MTCTRPTYATLISRESTRLSASPSVGAVWDFRPYRDAVPPAILAWVEFDRNGLEVLDRAECLRLLATHVLGRIGVTVAALPVVLPVNYGVFGEKLAVQTGRGTRLATATNETVVAFEVDEIDRDQQGGWSVVITGFASEVTNPHLLSELRALPFTRWVRGESDRYITVSLDVLSGRRTTNSPGRQTPNGEAAA